MTRNDIVAAARSWLGTPYQHHGRAKGVGVDCLGLIIGVGHELGALPEGFDQLSYTHQPDPRVMLAGLREQLTEIDPADAQPGDVLVLDTAGLAVHLGFKTDIGLLHAYLPAGQVVEHGLRGVFARAVRHAFALPGVQDG